VKRLYRYIHIARITATAPLRISNLGLPNVEMALPAAAEMELPAGAIALYVTISGDSLNRAVAREGRVLLRGCIRREYSLVILDMNLVRTADSHGLRWLARMKQAADWYSVALLTRTSPTFSLVLRSTGFRLTEFAPSRLRTAHLAGHL
jgi:hypothetical protein